MVFIHWSKECHFFFLTFERVRTNGGNGYNITFFKIKRLFHCSVFKVQNVFVPLFNYSPLHILLECHLQPNGFLCTERKVSQFCVTSEKERF